MIKTRAIAWAMVTAVLGIATAVLFVGGSRIETNLLALLPGLSHNPVVEQASAKLGEGFARRAVYLVGGESAESTKALARRFAESLNRAGVFSDVRAEFPAPDLAAVRDVYLAHRFHLLADGDRVALAGDAQSGFLEDRLRRRLYDPFRSTLGVPLERDPLGLLDNYLTALPYARLGAGLEFDSGALLATDAGRTYAIVLTELNSSPHDPQLQKRLSGALAEAQTALQAMDPETRILRAGVVHYATDARESAEREVDRIAVGSLLGIAVLLLVVFRSVRPLLLGLVSVAAGICAAAVATVAVFGNIHLITLVFGASLIGEAIDYSIQYFAARLDAGSTWSARRGLHAIFPGITIAVITSVLGYAALALAPFPALRQIALFSVVGLVVAYLTVVLLLPALARAPARYQPRAILHAASRVWDSAAVLRTVRARSAVVAVLLFASLPGWAKLTAADDIRLLVSPSPELIAQEAAIKRLTGFSQGGQFFVVEGRNTEEVLQREEALTTRLREIARVGAISHYQALSDLVPSAQRQQETYAMWRQRVFTAGEPMQTLARNGFRNEIGTRYTADFRQAAQRTLTLEAWLQSPISVPFRHLWLGEVAGRYASVVMPFGFTAVEPLERAAQGLDGVELVDKAGAVSRLFREYRRSGSLVLLIAVALVYGVLVWRYGWRDAISAMLPTLVAMAMTLAYCGYTGAPMTLFNMMALLLVLGVGVNYVIFLHEGIERRGAALVGVVLSAITTLLSFGLLGWSSTPALSQFGMTLFIGIITTVVLAPVLGPSRTLAKR
jgi:predicted exporter